MATKKTTPETAKAAPERDETTDGPVTELAHVDAKTSNKTLEKMSGVSDEPYKPAENADKEPSRQQLDTLENLKQTKQDAKHPEKRGEDVNPHIAGPGSDIG